MEMNWLHMFLSMSGVAVVWSITNSEFVKGKTSALSRWATRRVHSLLQTAFQFFRARASKGAVGKMTAGQFKVVEQLWATPCIFRGSKCKDFWRG